jgi:uncharacterized phage protein (TIGR02218 family)
MTADIDHGAALRAHLATGTTTICRCWALRRRDGTRFGFTDHDRDLAFGGYSFRAASGMTAAALQQGTGLAVDNSQAAGALSDAAVTEADLLAGLFDGAAIEIWRVNWAEVEARDMIFRGTLGEIRRADGAFEAELRGLAEMLNQPTGLVYQNACGAVLGDARCGVDLADPSFSTALDVEVAIDDRTFRFAGPIGFAERWFDRGTLRVETGAAAGLSGVIKADRIEADGTRVVALWQALRKDIAPGDRVRLETGCDKRAVTCRDKFANFANFRGFPHIPGDSWLTSYPAGSALRDGGSMNR